MAPVSEFIASMVPILWGPPLLLLLLGGGALLLVYGGFLPFLGFRRAIDLVRGRVDHPGDAGAEGQISHFGALMNALSATVGLGNIAGVAVAITQGGPGAVFWMWAVAVIGMNIKFFECSLAVMMRGKDYSGEVQGGPMYSMASTGSSFWKVLAYLFAGFALIGTIAVFQVNQLSAFTREFFGVSEIVVGAVSAVFVGYVLLGGVQKISKVTSVLVPAMCALYVLAAVAVVIANAERVPSVLGMIFSEAMNPSAVWGGSIGSVIAIGAKRAAFSNEAGVGTAPMAHSNVRTSEPISEGLVAMLGPFFDTIIICTLTAVVILVSFPAAGSTHGDVQGVVLTAQAFEQALPFVGRHALGVAVLLFSITTMIGYANYNEKCWNFLFRGRTAFGKRTFVGFYGVALLIGAVASQDDVVNIIDCSFALMAFPNMLFTVAMAPKVKQALLSYRSRYLQGSASHRA